MRLGTPLMRLIAVGLMGGALFIGYRSYQEHVRNAKIQVEIDTLAAEAEKIRRENETLAQRIEYFASPNFQEQEAKKKLGMRRQEETVVALREVPSLEATGVATNTSTAIPAEPSRNQLPNYKKWWHQFFE